MFTAGSADWFAVETAGFDRADLHAYAAVVPGHAYVFDISRAELRDDGPLDSFDFAATYGPVPDAYEPNDQPEAATVVTADSVSAYFAAGYRSHILPSEAFDDWYAVDVPGDRLDLLLDDVPANLQPIVAVYRADDLMDPVADDTASDRGQPLRLAVTTTPGRYLVRVGTAGDAGAAHGGEPTLPDNFFQPYTLHLTR